jgi:hypothetical protein
VLRELRCKLFGRKVDGVRILIGPDR